MHYYFSKPYLFQYKIFNYHALNFFICFKLNNAKYTLTNLVFFIRYRKKTNKIELQKMEILLLKVNNKLNLFYIL